MTPDPGLAPVARSARMRASARSGFASSRTDAHTRTQGPAPLGFPPWQLAFVPGTSLHSSEPLRRPPDPGLSFSLLGSPRRHRPLNDPRRNNSSCAPPLRPPATLVPSLSSPSCHRPWSPRNPDDDPTGPRAALFSSARPDAPSDPPSPFSSPVLALSEPRCPSISTSTQPRVDAVARPPDRPRARLPADRAPAATPA